MKKIFFLVFFLISININAFSKPRCDIFYDKLKNEYSSLGLENEQIREAKTFGFDIQVYFDETLARIEHPGDSNYKIGDSAKLKDVELSNKELINLGKKEITFQKGDWEVDKSKEGYYKVGKIWTQKIAAKLKPYDLIISADGKDIRNLDLSLQKNDSKIKDITDYFDSKKEIEFVFQSFDKNGKKYSQKIKSKIENFDYSDPFIDFYIESISINEKDATTNVTIETEFEEMLSQDFPMTKLARETLVFKKEDGKDWFEECQYSTDEWESLETINPNYGMVFENLVYRDNSRFEANFLIFPGMVGTWDFINEDYLSILYKSKGEYNFKTDFKLHSFPFDRQKIKVFAYQSRYSLGEYQASVSDWTKRRLISFANKENAIQGWNIVNHSANYKVYKDPNSQFYNDGVELVLTIERKSSYYIFKVILPIVLILMVCWSAVWIDPKEIESRLTITIVCLLSLIAYNFVIDSDMPKLEYLTIMDYIILISYVYAAIPNFLSIYSFQLIKKNKPLAEKYEAIEKRYGLLSYILIIFIIVIVNASSAPEHTNSMFTWAAMKN